MPATSTVLPVLSAAAASLSGSVAEVAGYGIAVGLVVFGIVLLVRTFKRTAR